ncbi:unnamed protein product, partial [Tilletia caries]
MAQEQTSQLRPVSRELLAEIDRHLPGSGETIPGSLLVYNALQGAILDSKALKSKCESVATAKRKAESLKRSRVGDDSDIDNEAIAKNGAARPSPRKKQNAPATTSRTSKNVGKGKQKAKEKSGKESDNSMTSEEDNGDDDEESDEEGDKTNATRFQSNVRSLFSGKSSTTAQNSAHVGASVGSST